MHATIHMQKYSFLQVPKNDLFQVLFLKKQILVLPPNENFLRMALSLWAWPLFHDSLLVRPSQPLKL